MVKNARSARTFALNVANNLEEIFTLKTVIYIGPSDCVEIKSEPVIIVKRGEPFEVPAALAKSLLAQSRSFCEPTVKKTGDK